MQGLVSPYACLTQAFILLQFWHPPLFVCSFKGAALSAGILHNSWFHYLRVTNMVGSSYHIYHIYLTVTMLCYNCALLITFFNFLSIGKKLTNLHFFSLSQLLTYLSVLITLAHQDWTLLAKGITIKHGRHTFIHTYAKVFMSSEACVSFSILSKLS